MKVATEKGILHPISARAKGIKTSLYVNDTAIFVSPTTQDITRLKSILDAFGQASGLRTNLLKSEVFPITCENAQLELIMESFSATVKSFPYC
jgi:hypothetical protein